jgi:autotransporter-associated beta strand protein
MARTHRRREARLRLERLEDRLTPAGVWAALDQQPVEAVRPGYAAGLGTMYQLTDGSVLVQGGGLHGQGQNQTGLASDRFFRLTPDATGSYVHGTFGDAGSLSTQRLYYAANVLTSGRLFALGGEYSGASVSPTDTNTGEAFDPITNTWGHVAHVPPAGFGDGPTVLLRDGRVLAGHFQGTATYLYNPATDQWAQTGSKLHGDRSGEETWALMPDGGVLSYDISASAAAGQFLAQRYVPAGLPLPNGNTSSGQWVDASPPPGIVPILSDASVGYELGAIVRLADGRMFVLGANGHTAFYTPATGTWTAGAAVNADLPVLGGVQLVAADGPAAVLPNGRVLLALSPKGSAVNQPYSFPTPTYLYDFDPLNTTAPYALQTAGNTGGLGGPGGPGNTGLAVALNTAPASQMRMLVVPTGHVLLSVSNSPTVWDYTPAAVPPSGPAPQVSGVGTPVNGAYDGAPNADGSYTLHGTYLTGFSEGAAYGDDAEMSTNFPLVRLTDSTDGTVWYARTSGWTPGVADPALRTVTFVLPPNLPAGDYALQVVASGVASAAIDFTPAGPGPLYVDAGWDTLPTGTALEDADPVTPGDQPGVIGVNCFGSTQWAAAVVGPSALPSAIVVNGRTGDVFHESVTVGGTVPLYVQGGPVEVDELFGGAGATVILSGATLTVGGDDDDATFAGTIVGSGGLTKVGSGTLTLAGADDVVGPTTVAAGNLIVSGSITGPGGVTVNRGGSITVGPAAPDALAGSTVTVNAANGLILGSGHVAVGGLAGMGGVAIGLGTDVIVGGNNADTTFAGVLSGGGSLTKVGNGTLTLTNTGNALGAAAVDDGTLSVTGALATTNGVTVGPAGPSLFNAGRHLRVGATNALAASTVIMNEFKGLDLTGLAAATLGGLAGRGVIDLGTTALTVGGAGDTTFAGIITGRGSLTKAGTGTLTLESRFGNFFTGGTRLSNGTLAVDDDADLGRDGGVTVAAAGRLRVTGTTATRRPFTLIGGTVAVAAGKTLTFTGGQVNGGYLSGPGAFVTSAVRKVSFSGVTVRPSATITVNRAGDVFANVVNGGTINVASGLGGSVGFIRVVNQTAGRIAVGAGSRVTVADFQSNGTLTLAPGQSPAAPTTLTNVGSTALQFNAGSQTYIGTPLQAPTAADVDLNGSDAVVVGGLFVNNGSVMDGSGGTATVIADAGALVTGAGVFQRRVVTRNGGRFQPGNGPATAPG